MDNMAFPAKWYGAGKVPPLSILSFFPGEPVHSAALVFCLLRKAFFKSKTGTCSGLWGVIGRASHFSWELS